ncbi:MAG: metal-dependent transcriptional regulator, partial [Bacilli bacterium]
MHRGEEDYIKYIYKLTIEANKNIVKNNILSELLGYTNQSVNEMVKRLVKKELVEFIPYKGVRLTQNGIVEAKRLVRNHSLWEVFLVNKLGYSW